MTDIETLTTENAALKDAINKMNLNNAQQLEALNAKLEAHIGMLNENINNCLMLRTNQSLVLKQNKELSEKNVALINQVAELTQKKTE